MNVATLSIDTAIIHEITKRQLAPPSAPRLILSNSVSALDADLRSYFQDRIVESLQRAAFPVVVDPGSASPTPALVHQQLTIAGSDFVAVSQGIAHHLFAAQTGIASSPGLVVIVEGSIDTGKAFGILKLAKHEGVRLEWVGQPGQGTYSVEHLRQLMLSNETRVFKVAVFEGHGVVDTADVHGVASDKQRFSSPEKLLADFFLKDFLGCRVRDDPAQTTSHYFLRVEKFINERVSDPEVRTRYHRALLTDMTSQSNMVVPKQFAEDHIDEAQRGEFLAFIGAEDGRIAQFPKKPDLIERRIREEEYVLASGIRVRGSLDALEEHAAISRQGDEMVEMLIVDRLESVNGTAQRR